MHDIPLPMKRGKPGQTVLVIAAVVVLLLASCAPSREALRKQAAEHPTMGIAYWGQGWQARPLQERIAPAPAELIEKIRIENRLYDFPERPAAAEPAPEFLSALKQIEEILPEKVRRLARERIIGLFLVADLGGSGYTEAIRDEAGREKFAVIVLDRELLLKRPANAWATWKEGSFFKPLPGGKINLNLRIEEDRNDSVENAIVYILLHEIGHALGMAGGVHPSWNGDAILSQDYPFPALNWRMRGDKIESLFDEAFPERRLLKVYAFNDAPLTQDQAQDVYRNLSRTGFPTLYAAVSPWEDFAESFVNYLHVVREKRPYEVRIQEARKPDAVFTSCWNEERCAARRAFLERWLEDPVH
ncbi:MAG: hypothetical protein NTW71_03265 [Deltaproteobacteria bacterium]|nr:hypothetical protein [Deltaproteobacteria bacterium]